MDVSFGLGIILASPVIIYQIWSFLSPALHQHEKRVLIPVLIGGGAVPVSACTLSVLWCLPITLQLLGTSTLPRCSR